MQFYKGALAALTLGTLAVGACGGTEDGLSGKGSSHQENNASGNVGMALTLPDDSTVTSVSYTITGPNNYSRTASVPVGDSTVVRFRVGLPVGNGYNIALSAETSYGEDCTGASPFNVLGNATTTVNVLLVCSATDAVGDLIVDGEIQSCPLVTSLGAIPAETRIGSTIALSAMISHGDSTVAWSGTGGTFSSATGYTTTFTCGALGTHTLTAALSGLASVCSSASTVEVVCSPAAGCGNSLADAGEECDDGNQNNNDGCTNACKFAVCGDGIPGPSPEECDDGNGVNTDACANACTANVCGNNRVDAGEACDGTAGCSPTCQILGCGDNIVTAPEQCDDGNAVNTDACTATCQNAVCGDNILRAGVEACDDGNTTGGDGCEADCTVTPRLPGDDAQQNAACRTCRDTGCRESYQGLGFDFVASCFNNPDPTWVQQCIDVKNCAYENDCGYNINGSSECFCGVGTDIGDCATPGVANGPCRDEFYAAARTTVLAEIQGLFGDISVPLGVAGYLMACDTDTCAACQP